MLSTAVIVDQLPSSSGWLSDAALRKKLQEIAATIESLTSQRFPNGGGTVSETGKAVGLLGSVRKETIDDFQWWVNPKRYSGNTAGGAEWNNVRERVTAIQNALEALQGLIIQTNTSSVTRSPIPDEGGRSIGASTAVLSPIKVRGDLRAAGGRHTNGGSISHVDPTSLRPLHPNDQHAALVSYADISMRRGFRDLVVPCFKDPLLRCLAFSMGNIQQRAVGVLIAFFQCARDAVLVESLANTFAAPLLHFTGSGKMALREVATTAITTLFSTHVGKGALSEAIRAARSAAHPRVRATAFQALLYALRQRQGSLLGRSFMTFLPGLMQVAHDGLTKEPHPIVRAGAARMFWGLWCVDASAAQHLLQWSPFLSGVREKEAVRSRLLAERAAALQVLGVVLPSSFFTAGRGKRIPTTSLSSSTWKSPQEGEKKKKKEKEQKNAAQETTDEGWSSLLCFLQDASLQKTWTRHEMPPGRPCDGREGSRSSGSPAPPESKRGSRHRRRGRRRATPLHGTPSPSRGGVWVATADPRPGRPVDTTRTTRDPRSAPRVGRGGGTALQERRSAEVRETDATTTARRRRRGGGDGERRTDFQRSLTRAAQTGEERHQKAKGRGEKRDIHPKTSLSGTSSKGAPGRPRGVPPTTSTPSSLSCSSSSSYSFSSSSSSSLDASVLAPQHVLPPSLPRGTPQVDLDRLKAFWYRLPYSPSTPPSDAMRQASLWGGPDTRMNRERTGKVRCGFRSALSPQYEWEPYRVTSRYHAYARAMRMKQGLFMALLRHEDTRQKKDGLNALSFHEGTTNGSWMHRMGTKWSCPCTSRDEEEEDRHAKHDDETRERSRHGGRERGWDRGKNEDETFPMREEEHHDERSIVAACVMLWKAYTRPMVLPHRGEESGMTSHTKQSAKEAKEGAFRFREDDEEEKNVSRPPQFSSSSSFFLFACSTVKALLQQDVDALQWLTPSRRDAWPPSLRFPTGMTSTFSPFPPGGDATTFSHAHSLLVPMEDSFFLSDAAAFAGPTSAASLRMALLQRVQHHLMLLSLLLHTGVLSHARTGDPRPLRLPWPKRAAAPPGPLHVPTDPPVQEGRLLPTRMLEEEEEEEDEAGLVAKEEGVERTRREESGMANRAASGGVGRLCRDQNSRSGCSAHAGCTAGTCSGLLSDEDQRYRAMEWETKGEEKEKEEPKKKWGTAEEEMPLQSASGHSPRRGCGQRPHLSALRQVSFSPSTARFSRRSEKRKGEDATGMEEKFPLRWRTTTRTATRIQEREEEELLHRSMENVLSRLVHRLSAWVDADYEPYTAVRRMSVKVVQSVLLASCHRSVASFSFPLRLNTLCGPIIRLCQSGIDDASEEVRQTALECLYCLLFAPSVPLGTSLDGLSACIEHWLTSPAMLSSTAGYRELLLCVGRLLECERRRQDHVSPEYRPSPPDSPLPRMNSLSFPSSFSLPSAYATVVTLTRPVVRRLIVALQQLFVYHTVEKVQQMSATVLITLQWAIAESREIMEEVLSFSQLQKLANWADACDSWPEMW